MRSVRLTSICAVVLTFTLTARHILIDDGLIYARFVRNSLSGYGLVFNQGEHVNSLTSPLFTWLLLFTSWMLRGHVILAEEVLFVSTFIAACFVAEAIVPWSGVVISTTAYFYLIIGMETTLFLLLLLLIFLAYERWRYNLLPVLCVLLLLTRFEGGLLVPIVAWRMWRERLWPSRLSFLPPAILLLGYALLNHHWYGYYLPSSATSKLGQALSGYWGEWPTAVLRIRGWMLSDHDIYRGAFRRTAYLIPFGVLFAYLGWKKLRTRRVNQVLLPFWGGLTVFYVLFNIPAYHWYWAPFIFFTILYAVAGVPKTRSAQICVGVLVAVAGVTNGFYLRDLWPWSDYVHVAEWIEGNTPRDARVEAAEIGNLGWYSKRNVVDILGLTCPKNAAHIAQRDVRSWLMEDRPEFIVVHKPLWLFEAVTREHPEYQEVGFHSGDLYVLKRSQEWVR
jgi:arabinofuranosyltransferase